MAKAANADSVAESRREPQFRSAVQLIRGGVADVKSRIGQLNEKIGEHWAKIADGYKVHPVAGKWFAKIDKLDDPAERQDILRSFRGLCEAADWPEMRDMVEMMEEKAGTPSGEAIADAVDEVKPKPRAAAKPKGIVEAKASAARHLRAVPDPVPNADPDADLADGAD